MGSDFKTSNEKLQEMILELAKGNFACRFHPEGKRDETEKVGMLLNMLAGELRRFFIHSGSYGEKNMADPYAFTLSTDLKFNGVNCRFCQLVGRSQSKLIGSSVIQYLTAPSAHHLRSQVQPNSTSQQTFSPIRLMLTFRGFPNTEIECWGYCHLLKTLDGFQYFFRGLPVTETKFNNAGEKSSAVARIPSHQTFKTLQLESDILLIRKVHQYIMENLHQSLPPTGVIARKFGLNEFKLKKGFKELFNTTIFKLHLDKRLELSKLAIENTPASLKIIAKNQGFKNYSHFSKTFKSKYGEKPSYFKMNRNNF